MKWISCFLRIFCALGLTLALASVPVYADQAGDPPPPREAPSRPPRIGPDAQGLAATGYCSSRGGDPSYESISSVDVVYNPDGTLRLAAHVNIANPKGCTPGQPCTGYDTYPEYLNIWIDWNNDKLWGAPEKVVDAALTGYSNISYKGELTYTTVVNPPPAVTPVPTWMRANLSWEIDQDDPCKYSWDWGNVVDRQVQTRAPKINAISAQGVNTTASLPETGSPVRIQADITLPTGYTLEQCSWTGDLTPGLGDKANGCRYEYVPATGPGPDVKTYGEKKVRLTISYKHTATGFIDSVSQEATYKVFFKKFGDDDGDCQWLKTWNGCEKNWFEYWKDDGAVPGLNESWVKYGNFTDPSVAGSFSPAAHDVSLGDGATQTSAAYTLPKTAACQGYTLPGAAGIDLAASTIAHLDRHKTDDENLHAGQPWFGKPDTDSDGLPDDYETGTTKTGPNNTDSCNLAGVIGAPSYKSYGDEELTARLAEQGAASAAAKDWSNPGKQAPAAAVAETAVAEAAGAEATGAESAAPADAPSIVAVTGPGAALAVDPSATLTGVYSGIGVDTNGNGQYESLKLSVGVQVILPADYLLIAYLVDSANSPVDMAQTTTALAAGNQTVALNFSGAQIRHHAVNGPYKVQQVILAEKAGGRQVASAEAVYTTPTAYPYTSFEPAAATFNNIFTSGTSDTNQDTLADLLKINVGVEAQTAGTYTLYGEIYGSQPSAITTASRTQALTVGLNTVTLEFDGRQIYYSKAPGPFSLRNLSIKDANGQRLDFLASPYAVYGLTYDRFQHGSLAISNTGVSSQGEDTNKNGKFDYLRVQFSVSSTVPGSYTVSASLKDGKGSAIGQVQRAVALKSGVNAVTIDFPAGMIRAAGADGPYKVNDITLFDLQGVLADVYSGPHTTNNYKASDFDNPLLSTPGVTYTAGDADQDGKYEYLALNVPVTSGAAGVVSVQALFTDSTGKPIQVFNRSMVVSANSTQTFILVVWGSILSDAGKAGPFQFRDLTISHSADLSQAIFTTQAYVTEAYPATAFERQLTVGLPVVRR